MGLRIFFAQLTISININKVLFRVDTYHNIHKNTSSTELLKSTIHITKTTYMHTYKAGDPFK
jgi:hypothetical protein